MFITQESKYNFEDKGNLDEISGNCYGEFIVVIRTDDGEEYELEATGALIFVDEEQTYGYLFDLDDEITSVSCEPKKQYGCIKEFASLPIDSLVEKMIEDLDKSVKELVVSTEPQGVLLERIIKQHKYLNAFYNEYERRSRFLPSLNELYNTVLEFCFEMTYRLRKQFPKAIKKPVCHFDFDISSKDILEKPIFYMFGMHHFALRIDMEIPSDTVSEGNLFDKFCEECDIKYKNRFSSFAMNKKDSIVYYSIWEFDISSPEEIEVFTT